MKGDVSFDALKKLIKREKEIVKEIDITSRYYEDADEDEKKILSSQMKSLKQSLFKINKRIPSELSKLYLIKPLKTEKKIELQTKDRRFVSEIKSPPISVKHKPIVQDTKQLPQTDVLKGAGVGKIYSKKELKPDRLERETIKRMKAKGEKKEVKDKKDKANPYVWYANKLFSKISKKIVEKKGFQKMEEDLIKANLKFMPHNYISVIFLSTIISFFIAIFLTAFFLFFNISATMPIISLTTEAFAARFLKVFWMLFAIPIGTFFVMFVYPSLEKSAAEIKIDEEIPFATIHMSAISGSMINPSEIFKIIILTKEYPSLEKEFIKLINEINIYGYDLVSALKSSAKNSPSKKLAEIFNGLSTTINSGGDLANFFEKRSQTLLFEHGIEKEKKTKAAETFMDIYISVVVAAPMILMMLLMMMKISGLGLSLSIPMITIIIVTAVTIINVVFLTFLDLKR